MNSPNFSPEQMLRLLMNTKGGAAQSESMAEDLVKNKLSNEQRERLESVLHDKAAVERIMSSPQAKALLEKLSEKRG